MVSLPSHDDSLMKLLDCGELLLKKIIDTNSNYLTRLRGRVKSRNARSSRGQVC